MQGKKKRTMRIRIEITVITDEDMPDVRERVRNAVNNPKTQLHKGLKQLGWSGNAKAAAETVNLAPGTGTWVC